MASSALSSKDQSGVDCPVAVSKTGGVIGCDDVSFDLLTRYDPELLEARALTSSDPCLEDVNAAGLSKEEAICEGVLSAETVPAGAMLRLLKGRSDAKRAP